MKFLHFLTSVTQAAATPEATEAIEQATEVVENNPVQLFFQPANFLYQLQNMGFGMLVIFVIIGIIVLATLLINKFFAD